MLRASLVLAAAASAAGQAGMESIVGDPGMQLPPAILAEGWNMCNKASDLPTPHCTLAPRWADCVPLEGAKAGPGPNGNLVTEADNAAGVPGTSNSSVCDAATEAKERNLGALCARPNGGGSFWTSMLKSGNFDVDYECVLCGLWCKDDGCCPKKAIDVPSGWPLSSEDLERAGAYGRALLRGGRRPVLGFNNLSMNAPFINHTWSARQADGTYRGALYGSYDAGSNPQPPSATDLHAPAFRPPPRRGTPVAHARADGGGPPCDMTGTWVGTDKQDPVTVVMAANGSFVANAAPWGAPRPGTQFPNGSVVMTDGARVHRGVVGSINSTAPACSAVLWEGEGPWCRESVCGSGVTPSYLAIEWFWRDGGYVYRNTLKTNPLYPWLMIYTGADTTRGWKGGYPWDGRGMMTRRPLSSPSWADNDFRVRFWLNVSHLDTSSSFYFLNTGSCWQMDGSQCTGDVTRDVTRYILMDLNAQDHVIGGPGGRRVRCSPRTPQYCPHWHRRADGTVVPRSDPAFPFDAYIYASSGMAEPGATSAAPTLLRAAGLADSRARGPPGLAEPSPLWHFDNFSNPQAQDFVKIAPSPEWAQYGFPASRLEVMQGPRLWNLNVGQFTGVTPMLGVEPEQRVWATFNVGPEMGLGSSDASLNVWEIARFDVRANVTRTLPA